MLVRQMVGCKRLSGADILDRQRRIVGDDLFHRVARREAAQNMLDCDARSRDTRFAKMDIRIN